MKNNGTILLFVAFFIKEAVIYAPEAVISETDLGSRYGRVRYMKTEAKNPSSDEDIWAAASSKQELSKPKPPVEAKVVKPGKKTASIDSFSAVKTRYPEIVRITSTYNLSRLNTQLEKVLHENPTDTILLIGKVLNIETPTLKDVQKKLAKLQKATESEESMNENLDLINEILGNISEKGSPEPFITTLNSNNMRSIKNFSTRLKTLFDTIQPKETVSSNSSLRSRILISKKGNLSKGSRKLPVTENSESDTPQTSSTIITKKPAQKLDGFIPVDPSEDQIWT